MYTVQNVLIGLHINLAFPTIPSSIGKQCVTSIDFYKAESTIDGWTSWSQEHTYLFEDTASERL